MLSISARALCRACRLLLPIYNARDDGKAVGFFFSFRPTRTIAKILLRFSNIIIVIIGVYPKIHYRQTTWHFVFFLLFLFRTKCRLLLIHGTYCKVGKTILKPIWAVRHNAYHYRYTYVRALNIFSFKCFDRYTRLAYSQGVRSCSGGGGTQSRPPGKNSSGPNPCL